MPLFPSLRRKETVSVPPQDSSVLDVLTKLESRLDEINTRLLNVSSDYYNNRAHEHAMDVSRANPNAVAGGMWNSIVARESGAAWSGRASGLIYHGYRITYTRKVGKRSVTQDVQADEISVTGTVVMFFLKQRIQKIVRQDDILEIDIISPTTMGEELAKLKAQHE